MKGNASFETDVPLKLGLLDARWALAGDTHVGCAIEYGSTGRAELSLVLDKT